MSMYRCKTHGGYGFVADCDECLAKQHNLLRAQLAERDGQLAVAVHSRNALAMDMALLDEKLATSQQELKKWCDVFGHLGTPDEVGNEWLAITEKLAASEARVGVLEKAAKNVVDTYNLPLWHDGRDLFRPMCKLAVALSQPGKGE